MLLPRPTPIQFGVTEAARKTVDKTPGYAVQGMERSR